MSRALTSDQLAEISGPAELESILSWIDDLRLVAAARPQAPVAALVAERRRVSLRTVYGKLAAWRDQGPLALRDGRARRRSASAPSGPSSPAFVAWVHTLYHGCARANATPTVQGLMLARLSEWRRRPHDPALRIPGYDTPPLDSADSRYRHPAGWSQRRLNTLRPRGYQATDGRVGRLAAQALLPPVLTTRVGLPVGSHYLFDDQFYDLMVHWGDAPVRPVGLNVLDLASACDVMRGIRPYLGGEADGEKALTRRDTLWLVVQLLTLVGYHPGGCALVFESGTSRVDDEFRRLLALATDGVVRVEIGEVSKEIVGGVLLPSKGNPRFKAPRESWFNLARNRMGHLPLALGMDRDAKPESTDRLVAEEGALLRLASTLPPAVVADLQFEGLPWSRFAPLANLVAEAINRRTEHQIEGWAACGRERVEYRIGDQWVTEAEYLTLAPDTRALVVDRMRRGETVSRLTRMSPREVFDAGAGGLARISPYRWHLLIPHSHALARKVPSNRQLQIQSREYGPEPLHFLPHYRTESGDEIPLPPGADLLLFLSPLHPSFALVTRPDGTPLGLVFAVDVGTRDDRERLLAQWAVRHRLAAEIAPTSRLHAQNLADQRGARREHNAAVLESAGVAPKAVAKVRRPAAPRKPAKRLPRPVPAEPAAEPVAGGGLGIL